MSNPTSSNILYTKIKDNVFKCEVHLVIGDVVSSRDFIAQKLDIHGHPGNSYGEFISDEEGRFILWLEKHDGTPHCDDILAHEVFHCVKGVMSWVGMSLSDESEEAYSHYAGFLTGEIKKFLNEKK